MKAIARYSGDGQLLTISDGSRANLVVKIFFHGSNGIGAWKNVVSIEQEFMSWDMPGIPDAAILTSYHSYIMTKEKGNG